MNVGDRVRIIDTVLWDIGTEGTVTGFVKDFIRIEIEVDGKKRGLYAIKSEIEVIDANQS